MAGWIWIDFNGEIKAPCRMTFIYIEDSAVYPGMDAIHVKIK